MGLNQTNDSGGIKIRPDVVMSNICIWRRNIVARNPENCISNSMIEFVAGVRVKWDEELLG